MNYIIRHKYLDKIKPFINQSVVKVITGMRRVGKSTLMEIIKKRIT